MMTRPETEDIGQKIREYIGDHEHAADNVQGIAQWWLGTHGAKYSQSDVEFALKELVEAGVMMEITNPDGTVLYKGNVKNL